MNLHFRLNGENCISEKGGYDTWENGTLKKDTSKVYSFILQQKINKISS